MKDENITTKAQSEIISEEQMEDVLDLMIRSGTIPDPRIDDEKARQAKQEKARKVYHNTLLLFQRYRDIIWVLQSFTTEVATELDQPLSDIDRLLSAVDVQLSLGNRKLENQLSRTGKTRMLIDRVNKALSILKSKPGNGKLLYDVLYQTYITDEVLPHRNILYRLQVSDRQYYRLRQQALDIISLQLWSAPGNMGLWLEVLEILNKQG